MKRTTFRGRRAAQIESSELRLTVTQEGGHIAELVHKATGVSPLWIPEWRSIEPSEFSPELHADFGDGPESRLVAGLMGHNICLDLFGSPDPEEAAAGIPVHGEAPVAAYEMTGNERALEIAANLPKAEMNFRRSIEIADNGIVCFEEIVENYSCTDRPIGWTQHVTLGAPFLERGSTRFSLSGTRSKVYEGDFNDGLGMQLPGAEFEWPLCPRKDGGVDDFSTFTKRGSVRRVHRAPDEYGGGSRILCRVVTAFRAGVWVRMETRGLSVACALGGESSPALGSMEQPRLRAWDGVRRISYGGIATADGGPGKMFSTPTFRWIPAQSSRSVRYCAFLRSAGAMPQGVRWDGGRIVALL